MNRYDKTNNLTLFSEKSEHVSIFDPRGTLKVNGSHLGYVAYQKNVVYAFIKLSAKSRSFNILCTMDGLSYPTMMTGVYIGLQQTPVDQEQVLAEVDT